MSDRSIPMDGDHFKIKRSDQNTMWEGFSPAGAPPFAVSGYFNDFHSWVPDEWTATEATAATQVLQDKENGWIAFTAGATEDQGAQFQLGGSADSETVGESFLPKAGRTIWLESRIESNDVTQNDFFVGLAIEDTSIIASNPANMIGFITHDGDALLDFTHNGSIEEGVHTLVDGTEVVVGFKMVGTDYCEVWVNGVKKATVTTDLPSTEMKLSIAQLTGENVANTLEMDYIAAYQTRT